MQSSDESDEDELKNNEQTDEDVANDEETKCNEELKCVNCPNCVWKCQEPTDYNTVNLDTTEEVGDQFDRGGTSEASCVVCQRIQSSLDDRLQSADAPAHDPPATEQLKQEVEAFIIARDSTNPLRATIYEHHDENGLVTSRCLVWGAVEVFPQEIQDRWTPAYRKKNPQGYGILRISHLRDLLEYYQRLSP